MAKQLGRYFQVAKGDAASPEVFNIVAGQRGLQRSGSTNLVDQSDKTNYPYAVQAPGRTQFQITVPGVRDLPDPNGLEAVYAQWLAGTASQYQILNTEPSPDTVVFQASMYVSNFEQDDPDEESGSFTFTLTLAAAPTVDDLTP